MSNELKYHIDNFDMSLLSNYEQSIYKLFLDAGDNHRVAVFRLINQIKSKSYYLYELEVLIEHYDLNIESYE